MNDPGFLICTAFCYMGVPPSKFKDMIEAMLECIWSELRAADAAGYQQRFAAARDELASYSKIRLLGKVFRFLMYGELGPGGIIRVTTQSQAVRERIIARLVALGATHAGLVAAEAVVRKVLLVIDAIIVANCAGYCGALQVGQALAELAEAAAQGTVNVMNTLAAVGQSVSSAIGSVLSSAVAGMYGQLDTANWALSPALPQSTRADLSVLGTVLWAQVRPGSLWTTRQPDLDQTALDAFLTNATRPLTSYQVPHGLMVSIASAVQQSIAQTGGSARVTADDLLAMSPGGLMAFLRDSNLLSFRQEPIAYGNSIIAAPPMKQ